MPKTVAPNLILRFCSDAKVQRPVRHIPTYYMCQNRNLQKKAICQFNILKSKNPEFQFVDKSDGSLLVDVTLTVTAGWC